MAYSAKKGNIISQTKTNKTAVLFLKKFVKTTLFLQQFTLILKKKYVFFDFPRSQIKGINGKKRFDFRPIITKIKKFFRSFN